MNVSKGAFLGLCAVVTLSPAAFAARDIREFGGVPAGYRDIDDTAGTVVIRRSDATHHVFKFEAFDGACAATINSITVNPDPNDPNAISVAPVVSIHEDGDSGAPGASNVLRPRPPRARRRDRIT